MPLNTDKLRKSPAVRYAIKEFRKSKPADKAPKPVSGNADKPVEVVRIEKKPIKAAIEKIKKYFS